MKPIELSSVSKTTRAAIIINNYYRYLDSKDKNETVESIDLNILIDIEDFIEKKISESRKNDQYIKAELDLFVEYFGYGFVIRPSKTYRGERMNDIFVTEEQRQSRTDCTVFSNEAIVHALSYINALYSINGYTYESGNTVYDVKFVFDPDGKRVRKIDRETKTTEILGDSFPLIILLSQQE
jgi:phosphomannomutase